MGRLERVCRLWRQIMLDYGWKKVHGIGKLVSFLNLEIWILNLFIGCQKLDWADGSSLWCSLGRVHLQRSDHRLLFGPKIKSKKIFFKFICQILLISQHFRVLEHLEFRSCKLRQLLKRWDETTLPSVLQFGVRLRSLTLFKTVCFDDGNYWSYYRNSRLFFNLFFSLWV